jgi:hypothetical protein
LWRIALRWSALALLEEGYSEQTAEGRESHGNDGSYHPIKQCLADGFGERPILVHPYSLVDLSGSVGILADYISHRLEKGRHHGLAEQKLERDSDHEIHDRANSSREQPDESTIAGLHRINR